MRNVALLMGLVAVLGCDDNRNVAVSNSNPLGTVGGVVLDVEGEGPIAGATVTLESAGTAMMAMTDAGGVYTFAKVPAGDFFLTIAAPSYASAYVPGTLSGAVGNFPVSNPQTTVSTVELFKTSGTFSVALVDDRGAPVAGVVVTARVQVKYFAYNYPYGSGSGSVPILSPFGQYAVTATSDANGVAAFAGLPTNYAFNLIGQNSTQMFVDVPPIVIMGTTTYQFAGASYDVNPTRVSVPGAGGNPLPSSVYTLQLVGPSALLKVLYSSVDYLATNGSFAVASVVPVDKPISVTFNQAVNQQSLRAQLLDENGAQLGNLMPTFAAGNIVSLAPPAAFAAGKRYNIVLHASPLSLAAGSANTYNVTAPFFTTGPATLAVTATYTALPVAGTPFPATGHIVLLTFSEAVGLGKGTSPTLNCVAWYEGADLDASGNVSYQGEYATALPACPSTVAPAAFDMTKLVPYEPNPAVTIPTTGFTNKWYAQVDDTVVADGCKTGVATCTKPAAASVMHLLFSHLDSSQTFTRANGQVVGDMTVTIQ